MTTSGGASQYLWVMEVFDPFDRPPSTTFETYQIELRPGMQEEEFERYMIEQLFPAVGNRPTRRWHVAAHHLLKRRGAVRDPLDSILRGYVHDEGVREVWEASASNTSVGGFARIGGWSEPGATER